MNLWHFQIFLKKNWIFEIFWIFEDFWFFEFLKKKLFFENFWNLELFWIWSFKNIWIYEKFEFFQKQKSPQQSNKTFYEVCKQGQWKKKAIYPKNTTKKIDHFLALRRKAKNVGFFSTFSQNRAIFRHCGRVYTGQQGCWCKISLLLHK